MDSMVAQFFEQLGYSSRTNGILIGFLFFVSLSFADFLLLLLMSRGW